ncbi:MAG: cobyrinate a,c-diamide synthase [Eubacterium sp.]|nr:cobyrinate a,c-diamide synthase [Eubacterium sp.]
MAKGIMIAAAKSGSGKTTFTCGLLKALKDKNIKVRSFKCGPDYIDPMFHREVIGIEGGNLDSFFCDEKMLAENFLRGSLGADISVIEGVMGIYDGSGANNEGSSYDVALKLSVPVILIFDCSGVGKTVVSMIKGILADDTAGLIKGVVLNNITEHYYKVLKPLIEESITVVGYLPKMKDVGIESRHLGLDIFENKEEIKSKLDAVSSQIKKTVDIDGIIKTAENAQNVNIDIKEESHKNVKDIKIAVARDRAFCFYYEENIKEFENSGAEIKYFSPLKDAQLPEGVSGIYIGGGYPELYKDELAQNTSILNEIKKKIEGGMPSLAECGGFMYLQKTLEGRKMVGVIDAESENKGKLIRFGYRKLSPLKDTFIKKDDTIKAHEFHYYDSSDIGKDVLCVKASDGTSLNEIFAGENYWWGYPHLYLPSNKSFAENFAKRCREYKTHFKETV